MNIIDFILSSLPSSPIYYLVYLGVFSILGVGLIFLLSKKRSKSKNTSKKPPKKRDVNIDDLLKIATNSKSSTKDLLLAMQMFNEFIEFEKDIKKSFQFFDKILKHNNRNKELFRYFHDVIVPKNSKYKDELDAIEKEALNKD